MIVEVQKVPSGPLGGRSADKVKRPDYALRMVVLGTFWTVLLVAEHPLHGYYVYYWRPLWLLHVVHQIYSIPAEFVLEADSNSGR